MIFSFFISIFIWSLMRVSQIECTISEVKQRQYQSTEKPVLLTDEINVCDEKLDFLIEKNRETKNRRDSVDTKAHTLLTLTSLLLGLLFSASSFASAKALRFWAIFPLTLLFFIICLLIVYFSVNKYQTTDNSYLFLNTDSAKRILCNDLILSQDYNNRATDFMVDLYRSALRYFGVTMLLIMFLGIKNLI